MILLQMNEHFYHNSASKEIADLADNVRKATAANNASSNEMTPLASDFHPGPMDVICGRGKKAFEHTGNCRYRHLIHMHLEKYSNAKSKLDKSLIVSAVVDAVREASPTGGFVKEVDGKWYEVGDHIAREKVGQGFRDILHTKYKSSTKAKKRRRKEMEGKVASNVADLFAANGLVESSMEQITKIRMRKQVPSLPSDIASELFKDSRQQQQQQDKEEASPKQCGHASRKRQRRDLAGRPGLTLSGSMWPATHSTEPLPAFDNTMLKGSLGTAFSGTASSSYHGTSLNVAPSASNSCISGEGDLAIGIEDCRTVSLTDAVMMPEQNHHTRFLHNNPIVPAHEPGKSSPQQNESKSGSIGGEARGLDTTLSATGAYAFSRAAARMPSFPLRMDGFAVPPPPSSLSTSSSLDLSRITDLNPVFSMERRPSMMEQLPTAQALSASLPFDIDGVDIDAQDCDKGTPGKEKRLGKGSS